MDVIRELATARVVTLMTPREKSSLEEKARKAGLSVGEIVRRSVDAYDPEEMRQLEEIARTFREHAERALAAVDRANETIEAMRKGLSADVSSIDKRLVRIETIIEITRTDGATLRIARDPE